MKKIAFFGGLANNMYVFAKQMFDQGLDCTFIRDPSDSYIMSQPYWEDVATFINSKDISAISNFDHHLEFEKKNYWQPRIPIRSPKNFEECVFVLKEFDIILCCGIFAEMASFDSKTPYIIWPHGGDIRTALFSPKLSFNPKKYFKDSFRRSSLLNIFKNAKHVASHDPSYVCGDLYKLKNKPFPLKLLPIPIGSSSKFESKDNSDFAQIPYEFEKLFSNNKLNILIPSRLDHFWKGHQLFFDGIEKFKNELNIICMGWGNDMNYFINNTSSKNIKVLDIIVSKPILSELFRRADLVVDQFKFGTYGTAAIESISTGTPVLSYINNKYFENMNWQPPPLLNCHTVTDIKREMDKILSDRAYLSLKSKELQSWHHQTHSPDIVKLLLSQLL